MKQVGTGDGGGDSYTERRDRKKDQRATSVCMPTKVNKQSKKKEDKGVQAHEMQSGEKCVGEFIKMGAMSNGKPVTWAMQCLKFG